jgi:Cd2+/Zn2+-exporting ATPase
VEALRAHTGVLGARPDAATLLLEIDPRLVAADACERLALDAGQRISARYEHQILGVAPPDQPRAVRLLGRIIGVHYAQPGGPNSIRIEYDRQQIALETILAFASQRHCALAVQAASAGCGCAAGSPCCTAESAPAKPAAKLSASAFVCGVEGMCCSAETGPIERAVRALPGVRQVHADATLARLSVDFDPQALSPEQIVRQVERLGFKVQPTTNDQRPTTNDQRNSLLASFSVLNSQFSIRGALTALCAALIAAGWAAELLGYKGAAAPLYILATLSGGVFVARSGLMRLWSARVFDINALMSLAAAGALALGDYAEAAAVVGLFALGNALESYTMGRARRSIGALARLMPETALVLRGGREQRSAVAEVLPGETVLVRPGERVPLDGTVSAGESSVDQAPITGESMPVPKTAGAEVFAGSINGPGALEVRVTRGAGESTLARVVRLVEQSQAHKAPTQRFVDRFATYYTPAVLVLALLVALVPPLLGGAWADWITRALTLLVIACPCALVISTPVSIVSAISAAARRGVLFKGGAALEAAGGLRAVAFDKTGTLTVGKPTVSGVFDQQGREEGAACPTLQLAAAVERRATHPLARAIVSEAERRALAIPSAEAAQMIGGRGAKARVGGREVLVGNRSLFGPLPDALERRAGALEVDGATAVLVGWEGAAHGVIGLADTERPESRAVVEALRSAGIGQIAMLTGDHAAAAERIAARTGVDTVHAGLLPEDKLTAIDGLLERYGHVAMVGDGVNDAPALARASLGVAMGAAGSHAALEAADVALLADDLSQLPFAVRLSRRTRRIITQNVTFALAVKALFLGAAVLGAATLWMAVLADTGAALVVILNGMRLLREK